MIFQDTAKRINGFLQNEFPVLAGAIAVQHFDRSFANKGFTDKSLKLWKPVIDPKTKKPKQRPLVSTGRLRRSIDMDTDPGSVTIYSDVEYAAYHNQGGSVKGRPPKRQFMGKSEVLENNIENMIYKQLDNIFK